jgi:hypothetical protein
MWFKLPKAESQFKAFALEPSKEKSHEPRRKSFFFDPTPPSLLPVPTSGFRSMVNKSSPPGFSIRICLLISLFLVIGTTGFYTRFDYHGQLHGLFANSGSSMMANKVVADARDSSTFESTAGSTSQVQFDEYSLMLNGQRIFL